MSHLPRTVPQNVPGLVSLDRSTFSYFDYDAALALRAAAQQAGLDVPPYLLVPEVGQLLHYLPDLNQQMLFATLWNTGARLNELLALTPDNFLLTGQLPFVILRTLKQRQRRGRPRKGEPAKRAVTLFDQPYVRKMTEYLATVKPARHAPVWQVHENTVRNWLNAAVMRAMGDGVTFSVSPITPHTFRHSYCMNLIQHGVPLKAVQALAGHERLESTEIYTRVFALDVGRQFRVRFSMPDEPLLSE
ncbi:tyrosine-type recombinase/integrase [Serratia ficaria]|uniref:tyrosine-type recombinase/integrase n=1 Tax=Serratia ficaria TaxID=61651 RepID=UPI000B1D28C4|nr:tyrosine-type recombinase/integrase [Serratia ficaria]